MLWSHALKERKKITIDRKEFLLHEEGSIVIPSDHYIGIDI